MRRFMVFILSFCLLCSVTLTACASESEEIKTDGIQITLQIGNPIMTVNGIPKEVDTGRGTMPVIHNNRTLVPIRAVIEELGGTADWNGDTKEVILTYDDDEIRLTVNSETAYFNGEENILDTCPIIIDGRTMFPIRFIAEKFHLNIVWKESAQSVTVTSNVIENNPDIQEKADMYIQIGETELSAALVDNSSTEALKNLLLQGSLTLNMSDYGNFEKVGNLGTELPRNDEQITTEPGDLILYQGNSFVIYYDTNSWNFTRLGKIKNITQKELKALLGDGGITITLSLESKGGK